MSTAPLPPPLPPPPPGQSRRRVVMAAAEAAAVSSWRTRAVPAGRAEYGAANLSCESGGRVRPAASWPGPRAAARARRGWTGPRWNRGCRQETR